MWLIAAPGSCIGLDTIETVSGENNSSTTFFFEIEKRDRKTDR